MGIAFRLPMSKIRIMGKSPYHSQHILNMCSLLDECVRDTTKNSDKQKAAFWTNVQKTVLSKLMFLIYILLVSGQTQTNYRSLI